MRTKKTRSCYLTGYQAGSVKIFLFFAFYVHLNSTDVRQQGGNDAHGHCITQHPHQAQLRHKAQSTSAVSLDSDVVSLVDIVFVASVVLFSRLYFRFRSNIFSGRSIILLISDFETCILCAFACFV